jgi:ribosomal protein RSM22 (predicted rRNA methylase)
MRAWLLMQQCPHDGTCPMPSSSWCHFSQRVQRTQLQMASKRDASVNWEDEKFSCASLSLSLCVCVSYCTLFVH